MINDLAKVFGIKVHVNSDGVGGWDSQDKGRIIKEPTRSVTVSGFESQEQLDVFKAIIGVLSTNIQEAAYSAEYDSNGSDIEVVFKVNGIDKADAMIEQIVAHGFGAGFTVDIERGEIRIGLI